MAKAGSRQSDFPNSNQIVMDEEVPLWPLSEIKRRLFNKIHLEWKDRWSQNANGSPLCAATKNFIPYKSTDFWKLLCTKDGNNRQFFSEIVFCITDHNYLPAFENKIDPKKDPNCFLCKEDEIMNVHHLLWKCPYTGNLRFKSFERIAVEESTAIAGANYNYKISAKQLACFLKGLKELGFNWLEIADHETTNAMPSDGSLNIP